MSESEKSKSDANSATKQVASALDTSLPQMRMFLLNNAVTSNLNTLKVSPTGAVNNIEIIGVNFDSDRVGFAASCAGLSLFNFEVTIANAKKLKGTFQASGNTFPGLSYPVLVYLWNVGLSQIEPATVVVVA